MSQLLLGEYMECLSCQQIYVYIVDIVCHIDATVANTCTHHPPTAMNTQRQTDRHTNYIKPLGAEGNGSAVTKFAGVLQSPLPDSLLQHTLNI